MRKMLYFALVLLMPFLGCSTHKEHGLPVANPANDDTIEAAKIVLRHKSVIEVFADECLTILPQEDFAIRMTAALWRANNLAAILTAERELTSKAERFTDFQRNLAHYALFSKRQLNAESKEDQSKKCFGFVRSIFRQQDVFRAQSPKSYALLEKVYLSIPDLESSKLKQDFTIGCMKRSSNSGMRDFKYVSQLCECATNVVFSHLSIDKMQSLLSKVDVSEFAAELQGADPKVMVELAACATQNHEVTPKVAASRFKAK